MEITAAYVTLLPDRSVARTIEVGDNAMVDVDADGCPIGIETLDGASWQSVLVTLAMRGRLRIV